MEIVVVDDFRVAGGVAVSLALSGLLQVVGGFVTVSRSLSNYVPETLFLLFNMTFNNMHILWMLLLTYKVALLKFE